MSSSADRLAPLEEHGHFWFAGRDRLVHDLMDRFAAGDPVLDLGCGTGRFAGQLAEEGTSVVALDRHPSREIAPEGKTIVGDAERIALADSSLATVLARDVLEHIDDARSLGECHRILQPDGLLIVLVPGWPSLWSHRDVRAEHLRRYKRRELRRRLEEAGFEVVHEGGYQFLLLPMMIASRLLARFRGAGQIDSEDTPPRWLNFLLGSVNRLEAALARVGLRPPTGTTLVAVGRRR
jgi:SAM-dependent methyltransferase